ncbi:MAG TPA: hypothetical protein VNN72_01130, partial [Polyangiaceae bacterium]|nr:hypothetical protein [Polyangiaceae bacterium]
MKAVGPKGPAPRQKIVQVAGHADGNAADTARERALVLCLDHEVDVVALHGEMQEPKAVGITPAGTQEREAKRGKDMLTSQVGDACAEGDVNRLARAVRRTRAVRRIGSLAALAACPRSCAAPREWKRQGELGLLDSPRSSPNRGFHHLEFSYSDRNAVVKASP